MRTTTIRVMRREPRKWAILREGAKRASKIYRRKDDAVTRAKELAKNRTPSTLIVHGKNGDEQFSHTYNSK